MCEPGYYKTNYRALSLRDVARRWGWLRLPLYYRITRSKKPTPAGWLPETWAELECKEEELSAELIQAVEPYRQAFKRLGLSEVGFEKAKRTLIPSHREAGAINFLDSSRRHFGQIIYIHLHAPPPISRERKRVMVSFTAVFPERTLSYTNKPKTAFGEVPNHEAVRIRSDDAANIYDTFVGHLKRQKEEPRSFPDLQSLKSWFDLNKVETLKDRVRRNYFIRMTDDEVAAVQGKAPPVLPN